MKRASSNSPSSEPIPLLSGDRERFTEIFEDQYASIYYFSKQFVMDKAVAEDIATESFLKLWLTAKGEEGVSNAKGFLFTVSRNACLDYLKRSSNEKVRESDYSYLLGLDRSEDEEAAAEVKAEILKSIHTEIEQLPTQAREIFKLSFIKGLKNKEIADRLKVTEQYVKNRKSEALKTLKLALKDKEWIWIFIISSLYASGAN